MQVIIIHAVTFTLKVVRNYSVNIAHRLKLITDSKRIKPKRFMLFLFTQRTMVIP